MRDSEREFSHNREVFISWTLDVFNNMQQYTELAVWVFQLYSPISFLRVDRSRALSASCRWKKMTSRTPTFIKNSLVRQSTAHQSISTTNLKNNLHTVQYKLLHKYIDFYQPFIVKKSRASCNMHPAQVMQNIPKPELKILASNMSSQGIWLQTHGKTIINRQNYNLKFLFLDQHKC